MTEILIIIGLILLNGLFSMAEIALVSARKARLDAEAVKGNAEAVRALDLIAKPDMFISTIQLIITLVNLLLGIFSGEKIKVNLVAWLQQFPSLRHYSSGLATTILVVSITYLALVLGELFPKRIGLSRPEKISKIVAAPLKVIIIIIYPFVRLLTASGNVLASIFNIKNKDTQVTEDEIKAIINEGTEQGAIEQAEQQIIERVFHLSDRNITSLMTHRSDIVWVDISKTVGDIKKEMNEVLHSIYPVCEGQIDNIKGVVSVKDLFTNNDDVRLENIIKQPVYVPESNSAYQVLEKLKDAKVHHCFIVNEYGAIEGLITLNDILQALVGSIQESDEEDFEITPRSDGSFLIDAQIPFYNFLHHFQKVEWISNEETTYDTLAGFLLHQMQKIPATGETIEWKGFRFEIVDMDNHRIDKVLVMPPQATPNDE